MRRTTRFMAVALVALLAVVLMGAKLPGVTPAPGEIKPQQRVNLTSVQSAGVYYVADSYGLQNIYLLHGGSLAGTLYMCNETDADADGNGAVDTAAECVSLGSIGADLTLEGRKGTRRFIVIDIDTAEADGTPSKLTIFGTNDQVASGGGSTSDNDGDGLYEVAYLWDADGDGSGKVECTAADTPDPACKASGEVIYRDFSDDLNCAIHGGCDGTGQMEENGLLLLESGVVYTIWPCWDAREPAGFNDPTAANDNLHDATGDTAYNHCPATPDPGTDRRFVTPALMSWQGEIMGGGVDNRNPATTTGYKRDKGTYIVDDRGPTKEDEGTNVWFGIDGHIRGINFGYATSLNATGSNPTQTGEFVTDGDSKGYGTIDGDQPVIGLGGEICVADTSTAGTVSADGWAQTLNAGDVVIIETSSDQGANERNLAFAYRVRDTPAATTCNGTGTVAIPLGGRISSGTGVDYAINLPYTHTAYDGRYVLAARSDYFDGKARLTNVTLEPQDWWNEGGDCDGSGVWTPAGDNSEADFDCDTMPLVGFWGAGSGGVYDSALKHWHDRMVDGGAGDGGWTLDNSRLSFGNGGEISDPSAWRFLDNEIFGSQFDDVVFATFGTTFLVDGLTVTNSDFTNFVNFGDQANGITIRRVKLLSNSFGQAFIFNCGARNNVIHDLTVFGHEDSGGSDLNGSIARFICADTTEPIVGNTIDLVRMEGPGQASGGTGATNCAVVMDADSVEDDENVGAIRDNKFSNFTYVENGDNLNVEPSLFCIQDDATTNRDTDPDFTLEEILADNVYWGNSVQTTAGSGTPRVYAICGVNDAGGNGATHRCEDPIEGSGGGGADPIGCMNFENGAVPANQSCQ